MKHPFEPGQKVIVDKGRITENEADIVSCHGIFTRVKVSGSHGYHEWRVMTNRLTAK